MLSHRWSRALLASKIQPSPSSPAVGEHTPSITSPSYLISLPRLSPSSLGAPLILRALRGGRRWCVCPGKNTRWKEEVGRIGVEACIATICAGGCVFLALPIFWVSFRGTAGVLFYSFFPKECIGVRLTVFWSCSNHRNSKRQQLTAHE